MILASPKLFLLASQLCLLIAVAIGAFRHWCLYLWTRTEVVVIWVGRYNKTDEFRLGPHVPAWKSRNLRVGTLLLVAVCSTLGAALFTLALSGVASTQASAPSVLFHLPTIRILAILLFRWLVSAALGQAVAKYTLRKAQSLHTPTEGHFGPSPVPR